jgi:PAC2 family protein
LRPVSRILLEMPLYTIADGLPELRDVVMIASFDGWVDAAEAASGAVAHVAAEGTVLATFDADALFDYRSRRPILDVNDGRLSNLSWPDLTIRHARAGGRDLLVFSGAEPDLRWRELAEDVAELAGRLGVIQWISLGAVPAAVPHTRPVPVLATASREGLLAAGETQGPEGLLRVPSAAISALEMAVSASGTPAVGFFAQVPPYASVGYAAASIALLDRLGGHLGVAFDVDTLLAEEREQRARYDAAMAGDAILRETVSRLEEMVGDSAAERLPSGDELAREIQRFLSDRPDEPGPP